MSKAFKRNILVLYIFLMLCFLILSKANINGFNPFFNSFLFVLLWNNFNVYFFNLCYFLFGVFNLISISYLPTLIFPILLVLFVKVFHTLIKKRIPLTLIVFYFLISQIPNIYLNFNFNIILEIFFSVLYIYCLCHFFRAFKLNNKKLKYTTDEILCCAIFVVSLVLGLKDIFVFNLSLFKILANVLILISTLVFSGGYSLCLALLIGFSTFLVGDTIYILALPITAVFCLIFKNTSKYFVMLSLILSELILAYYFEIYINYELIDFLCVVISVVIFMFIPNKLFFYLREYFDSQSLIFTTKMLVNKNKEQIAFKLNELSQVFNEMNSIYLGMVKGDLNETESRKVLIEELIKSLCINCKNRNACYEHKKEETLAIFNFLFDKYFENGKITILDIPSKLSSRCSYVSNLISSINNLALNYKQYISVIKSADDNNIILAEQLKGVSNMLNMLSVQIGGYISFNDNLQYKIIENLKCIDCFVDNALVIEENDESVINLFIKEDNFNVHNIEKNISKTLKKSYLLFNNRKDLTYGNILEFRPKTRFGFAFGGSGQAKGKVSGDTYSFTKITNNKVMFAICDGMGWGEDANNISQMSINLIEDFYKVGFESNIILNSVNRLLAKSAQEKFSTLDICVLDLNLGYANFIKLGANETFIKSNDEIEVITGGALPLGVLENIKPVIKEYVLNVNDLIIMCSDGVIDSFYDITKLKDFILSQNCVNPQLLSSLILSECKKQNLSDDDKTVIVVKIFENF